ncbi:MAG: hypothetical protein AAF456_16485 [Planctomycetota bacterium]
MNLARHAMLFVALAMMPTFAFAQTFDGGGDGITWEDPLNWDGDALPGGDANVGDAFAVDLSSSQTISELDIAGDRTGTTDGTLNHSAGTLTAGGWMKISIDGGVGRYNLSGTAVATGFTQIRIGLGAAADGTLDLSGSSSLVASEGVNLGEDGSATLNVSDSASLTCTDFNAGTGLVAINLSGGSITANSWVALSKAPLATACLNQTGGTLNSNGDYLTIGEDGLGMHLLSGSAIVNHTASGTIVGRNPDGVGLLEISGSNAAFTTTDFRIAIDAAGMDVGSTGTLSFIADAGGVSPVVSLDNTELGANANLQVDLTADADFPSWAGSGTLEEIMLVENSAASTGMFAGLNNGDPVDIGGGKFAPINYAGGDGNDIVLEVFLPSGPITVTPSAFTVVNGTYRSGDLPELAASDNADLSANRNSLDIQSRITIEVTGMSPTLSPSSLEFTLEASVFARSNVIQNLELFNYLTQQWELVDSRNAARFGDSVVVANSGGSLSRFVDQGTMEVKTRVRYVSPAQRQQFTANVDQMIWVIGQ